MKIIWATDVHLDHASEDTGNRWLTQVRDQGADAVLLTGDISNCKRLKHHLKLIDASIGMPVYFVLGNHDAYGGSISQMRDIARAAARRNPHLVWLSEAGTVKLTERTALVGHDGWADARSGDYERSRVMMADFRLIKNFLGLNKDDRRDLMMSLADEASTHLRNILPGDAYEQVIVMTHVAPFPEAATYGGKISDSDFQPFFCNLGLGKVLLNHAERHPNQKMLVLCGHSHGHACVNVLPNLEVLSGQAEYRFPEITKIMEIS